METEKKELIKEIFDGVNYWLAFAEAKNAGLLAFNIAALAVLFSYDSIGALSYIAAGMIVCSTFCVFLALWSRFSAKWKWRVELKECDNLMYYRDISKYSESEFAIKLYKNYFQEDITNMDNIPIYLKNMISEININAKIATRKFDLFNYGIFIDVLSLVVIFPLIIIP